MDPPALTTRGIAFTTGRLAILVNSNQETKTLVAHFSIHESPQIPKWWRREDDYVETPQPAVAAGASDADFDEDYEEYERFLQPAVA